MRRDIQLLRGIAVLLVVVYHANIGMIEYGYLGVDVFFVVSGFLITSIILKGLSSQNFSFSNFYLRRAKRLLPALYSTLIFTSILAYFFLTKSQWQDFIYQLYGALTFSANMVLPFQIGYFENSAESKPLLHIWSLSLEEQYYFFLPLFLFLIPKRWRLHGLLALTGASLVWCVAWVGSTNTPPFLWRFVDTNVSEWAFYLFPTRAWELLAGSICAWVMLSRPNTKIHQILKYCSLLSIAFISCASLDDLHPRGDALLVVIATSLIILGKDDWLPRNPIVSLIERVGDWSYSVYLVHWPLFSFAYIGYLEQVPLNVGILLIFVSLFLGFIQFKFVETPFRHGWNSKPRSTWSWFAISTIAVFLIPFPVIFNSTENHLKDFSEIRTTNFGLSENCDSWFSGGALDSSCATQSDPKVAVWGDSYAMHLIPGLTANFSEPLAQFTKSACGPILGMAPVSVRHTEEWAEKCIQHNDKVFAAILDSETITHVVLSSTFNQYFKNLDNQLLVDTLGTVPLQSNLAIEYFVSTINRLVDAGKVPILVTPPPRSGFNIGDCLERGDSKVLSFRESCDIGLNDYLAFDDEILRSLESVQRQTGIKTIWLHKLLCDESSCASRIGDIYVYRDKGHLSVTGSEALLKAVDLGF